MVCGATVDRPGADSRTTQELGTDTRNNCSAAVIQSGWPISEIYEIMSESRGTRKQWNMPG